MIAKIRTIVGALAACLLLFLPTPLLADADADLGLSPEQQQQVELALNRGLKLYNYDRAAWLATDAMLEAIKDPAREGLLGWIVEEELSGFRVTFYKPSGDGYAGVFEALFDGEKLTGSGRVPSNRATFNKAQAELVEARNVVDARALQRCSDQPFNLAIIPTGKGDGSLFVYFLVPQPSLDEVEMGGHFRFEVRGGKQVAERKFTNSCLSLRFGPNEKGEQAVGLGISQIFGRVPTEIHVLSMLASQTPIYVMVQENSQVFVVERSGGQPRARRIE